MSRRDVIAGEIGEKGPRESVNLVDLQKSEHEQNAQQVEEYIKDEQEQHDPSYKPKPHSISTYLAIFQWILLIFCVLSNIYLLAKPSVKCECDGSSAQNQVISIVTTTNSPTKHPTTSPEATTSLSPSSHPFIGSSIDPTVFPSTQPTLKPTINPSFAPTLAPTKQPTKQPTIVPSFAPTKGPTAHPSLAPSQSPSQSPTYFDGFFVGDYKYSFRNKSHGFWLLCHGQWLDINQYYLLYDVMRYQFGHDYDSTNDISYFRVPDARDTVLGVIGSGHSMGQHIGNETYQLSQSEMPEHIHYFVGGASDACGAGAGQYITESCTETSSYDYAFQKTAAFETEFQTSPRGSNESFSLMQPTKFIGNLFVYSGEIHY